MGLTDIVRNVSTRVLPIGLAAMMLLTPKAEGNGLIQYDAQYNTGTQKAVLDTEILNNDSGIKRR